MDLQGPNTVETPRTRLVHEGEMVGGKSPSLIDALRKSVARRLELIGQIDKELEAKQRMTSELHGVIDAMRGGRGEPAPDRDNGYQAQQGIDEKDAGSFLERPLIEQESITNDLLEQRLHRLAHANARLRDALNRL